MALDTLSFNELLNFIIYDTISDTPNAAILNLMDTTSSHDHQLGCPSTYSPLMNMQHCPSAGDSTITKPHHATATARKANQLAAQGRKKRRRRPRVCKNKEEAETQRMTHIAVERNRRKQMNEHLAILKSLMPESYVQRGDQASIVGGAIEFVKELEHLLQSLEAQKLHNKLITEEEAESHRTSPPAPALPPEDSKSLMEPPFSQFFAYPQYTWSQLPNSHPIKYNAASCPSSSRSSTTAAMADIEVTLIETHANMRILSRRSTRQLSRLVAGFHSLQLSILHLNVTTVHPLVLYSISAKVEEGCQLTTVDDIAGAVHHMLIIIEEGEADRGGNYLC